MSVYLKIDDCCQCPHRGHKGGFGAVAYVPTCTAANRDLPYSVSCAAAGRSVIPTAQQEPGIPIWCPLRKQEEEE